MEEKNPSTDLKYVMEQLRSEYQQMPVGVRESSVLQLRQRMCIIENQSKLANAALENLIKDLNDKHKEDIETKLQDYQNTIKDLKQRIQDRDITIDQLNGKIEEFRLAKSLAETADTSKSYQDRMRELEECISESREKLAQLEHERERRKSEMSKMNSLETSMQESQKAAQVLGKLETIENELKEKQLMISEMEAVKLRLETAMQGLEKESLENVEQTWSWEDAHSEAVISEIARLREINALFKFSIRNSRPPQTEMEGKIKTLESSLQESQRAAQVLENKLEAVENELKEKQLIISQLEAVKLRLETAMKGLEKENKVLTASLDKFMERCKTQVQSDDSVRKVLEEQLAKIQSDWDETKRLLVLEEVRTEKLNSQITDLTRDNGLLKVDLRIATRKRTEMGNTLQLADSETNKLKEKACGLEETKGVLSTKLAVLEEEVTFLKEKIERKEKESATSAAIQAELSEQKAQLRSDNIALQNDLEMLKVKAKENENLESIIATREESIKGKMDIIDQKNRKIKSLENNVEVLKEASSVLDSQLQEFESGLDIKLQELHEAEKLRSLLENENREIREQLKKCRIELNEAKSLKSFTEKQLEMTQSSLKTQVKTKETEYHGMVEKVSVASKRNEELSAEVTALMTQVSKLEAEKFELRKNVESTKGEKDRLHKELSLLVNTVVDLKDENLSLRSGLKETLVKAESFKDNLESWQQKYSLLEQTKNTNELLLKTRIEQQDKLIDYLREQLASYQDKKKKKVTIFTPKRTDRDVYSAPKSGTPVTTRCPLWADVPSVTTMTPLSLKEEQLADRILEEKRANLRCQLDKKLEEKRTNSHHQADISEITRSTPTLPPPKKEECVLLKERLNTIAGGCKSGLGKSHKYRETRCEKTTKCMVCWDPIYRGRPISYCEQCKYVFHLACSATGSKTCGLSEKTAYEVEKSVSSQRAEPISHEIDTALIEGWVNIRTEQMTSADKRYLKIDGDSLRVYMTPKCSGRPLESFPLNESTKVYFRLDKKEQSKPDIHDGIAFAMKVSFYSEDVPSPLRTVQMFHVNRNQKRYWIRGILKYSKVKYMSSGDSSISDISFADENKENRSMKIAEKVLLEDKRSDPMYVNCVYWLGESKTYVLGCDDGLYSLKTLTEKPVKIEGPQAIYQIDVLEAAKVAVFIEGTTRALTTVYLGLLKTCAEAAECSNPKFKSDTVSKTKDCYIFTCKSPSLSNTVVAAASSNSLKLCFWTDGGLEVVKQIMMKDSITTLLMTEHSVLFGNHSVFELDTNTFELDEFLDMSDASVYYVKILNESHGSYPVAILDVTKSRGPKATVPEYLVCFQDIGIFVDNFGRRSRGEDILWNKVPVSFEYRNPYLFIFHFLSVEIQKLDAKSYTRVATVSKIESSAGGKPNITAKSDVKSHGIVPESRYYAVASKGSPNYVGKGEAINSVVFTVSDAHTTKVLELDAC